MIDVDKAIATAVKTGKVVLGANEALWSAKAGKARLIVLASNSPPQLREDIDYYGKLSQVPVVAYRSNSVDLGMVCGKRFAVTALTVKEPGDSDILKLTETAETTPESAEEEAEE
ncbi:MAG: 50S ribosomal protein L30e [Candidatus Bathyarchaeia archaeon]